MARLTFVTGLPGSGKSWYTDDFVSKQKKAGITVIPFNDFKKNSKNNDLTFFMSRNYGSLMEALRRSEDCIVNDVSFYDPYYRQEADQH